MKDKKKLILFGFASAVMIALVFSVAWMGGLLYWASKQVSPGDELLALAVLALPFYVVMLVLGLWERQFDATKEVSKLKVHIEALSAEVTILRSSRIEVAERKS